MELTSENVAVMEGHWFLTEEYLQFPITHVLTKLQSPTKI